MKGRLIVDPFTALNWNVISGADYIDKFRQASKHPLSEEELWQIRSNVLTAIQPYSALDRVPIVVDQDIRGDFANLLRVEFPDIAVLSENEISPSFRALDPSRLIGTPKSGVTLGQPEDHNKIPSSSPAH